MSLSWLKPVIIWGILVWLFGYVLGIVLFAFVPHNLIGWVIMPLGLVATFWVLKTKIKTNLFQHYLIIGLIWAILAIVLDYFLLVRLFKPQDGYYKLDVYLYYVFTFSLPLLYGLFRVSKK